MNKLKLTQDELVIVQKILAKIVPNDTVYAFGSRAKDGKCKPYSDLDLVVMSDKPLDLMVLARLNDAFDESNLVFKVDISDWASLSNEFRHGIKGDLILI